jgi:hypothetical protein
MQLFVATLLALRGAQQPCYARPFGHMAGIGKGIRFASDWTVQDLVDTLFTKVS